jgi:ribonuclease BN (tRNA processing enzyme)
MVKKAREKKAALSFPSYYLGICRFLQGCYKNAYDDFKMAKQYDLHHKIFDGPATRSLLYMEETIFPTREIILKNQHQLTKDLNAPRLLDKKMGGEMLRTIHKWNSSTPLFSHGISQGGGYLLTLRNPRGELKSIALDPGYDFYDIFRDLGLSIADLDAIIMTHDHDDHTESVEGILSLLARYNDRNYEKNFKVIDVFGSAGTLLKFHGLLSATTPDGGREINFKILVPGNVVEDIEGTPLLDKYGCRIKVKQAHHKERWTSQESSVGLLIETLIQDHTGQQLKIGITGDTRFEIGIGREYKEAQLLLINIGSIEKEEGQLLKQHLGMCGCINLLKEARLGKPLLAILTEFGEEFSGKRETISHIIENWAQPMEGHPDKKNFRVIPADVNLEIKLPNLNIRETDTNVFFHYSMINVEESSPETLKYRFNG